MDKSSNQAKIDCQTTIEKIYKQLQAEENKGEHATYIPELAKVDPNKFGVALSTIHCDTFEYGDSREHFSIQSIAKVLSLSIAIELVGKKLWERVGVEPSGSSFNSLVQLEYESGIPRNPFINAGALVVCDILYSHFDDPKDELIEFIRHISHNRDINYAPEIAESEKSKGYRNVALINFLKSFDNIDNDIDDVLDFYFYLCSIKMNCVQLADTFLYLVNNGIDPHNEKQIIKRSNAERVNAIMSTCGFYDESGEFAYLVGLPGKSGVGGGIVAVYPDQYAIAVWSPRLNEKGNSYRGMKFLERFTSETEASIF